MLGTALAVRGFEPRMKAWLSNNRITVPTLCCGPETVARAHRYQGKLRPSLVKRFSQISVNTCPCASIPLCVLPHILHRFQIEVWNENTIQEYAGNTTTWSRYTGMCRQYNVILLHRNVSTVQQCDPATQECAGNTTMWSCYTETCQQYNSVILPHRNMSTVQCDPATQECADSTMWSCYKGMRQYNMWSWYAGMCRQYNVILIRSNVSTVQKCDPATQKCADSTTMWSCYTGICRQYSNVILLHRNVPTVQQRDPATQGRVGNITVISCYTEMCRKYNVILLHRNALAVQ
jgi:hypothetical protein